MFVKNEVELRAQRLGRIDGRSGGRHTGSAAWGVGPALRRLTFSLGALYVAARPCLAIAQDRQPSLRLLIVEPIARDVIADVALPVGVRGFELEPPRAAQLRVFRALPVGQIGAALRAVIADMPHQRAGLNLSCPSGAAILPHVDQLMPGPEQHGAVDSKVLRRNVYADLYADVLRREGRSIGRMIEFGAQDGDRLHQLPVHVATNALREPRASVIGELRDRFDGSRWSAMPGRFDAPALRRVDHPAPLLAAGRRADSNSPLFDRFAAPNPFSARFSRG